MARVKLTKKMAGAIRKARTQAKVSQYALADSLGWPRAKVKRLELGETKTIDEEDLKRLEQTLNVQESSSKKADVPKKRSSSSKPGGKIISMFKAEALFNKVRYLREKGVGGNQVYFEVTMAKDMTADQLLGIRKVELLGVTGSINGVENTQDQNPLRAGDRVAIMLWGPGIGKDVRDLGVAKRAPRAQG